MKFNKRDAPSGDSQSSLFVRLKDGESIVGVPRGEVYEFFQVWEGGKSQVVSEDHPNAKSRFRVNLVVHEDGEFKARIWEFGLVIYNQLADIASEYDITQTKLKITRRGTGTDTVYMILPILKEPINAKALKAIEAVPLNILEHKQSEPKVVKNHAPGGDDMELPF